MGSRPWLHHAAASRLRTSPPFLLFRGPRSGMTTRQSVVWRGVHRLATVATGLGLQTLASSATGYVWLRVIVVG